MSMCSYFEDRRMYVRFSKCEMSRVKYQKNKKCEMSTPTYFKLIMLSLLYLYFACTSYITIEITRMKGTMDTNDESTFYIDSL